MVAQLSAIIPPARSPESRDHSWRPNRWPPPSGEVAFRIYYLSREKEGMRAMVACQPTTTIPHEKLSILATYCAHSNFNLVGVRNARAYAMQLGSVHLPEDVRRTHVRRSRHLLFTTRRSRVVKLPGSRGMRYT
ncbi:hypothetical protein CRG98_006344 [Punica granatum]|uniref:Uncharacterized protein n=1 Tax=Punica granatum TaxID=22663 RepID=A0A2I0KXT3_PUNGR|nr:hypothetical protein CRG98_006344 [Punica granatum]